MTKNEFLDILRISLEGEILSSDVENNIKYYEDYINTQLKQKSFEEIYSELGNPRLIAKTIIDTNKISGSRQTSNEYINNSTENEVYKQSNKYFNKLLRYIIGIIIIFVVIFLGSIAVKLFFSIGLPILIIVLIYKSILKH